jgi:hypothetical protein
MQLEGGFGGTQNDISFFKWILLILNTELLSFIVFLFVRIGCINSYNQLNNNPLANERLSIIVVMVVFANNKKSRLQVKK